MNLVQNGNTWSHTFSGSNISGLLGNPAGGLAYMGFTGAEGGVLGHR